MNETKRCCNCVELFDCCSCGGNDCGCSYCWDCNACDDCKNEEESYNDVKIIKAN